MFGYETSETQARRDERTLFRNYKTAPVIASKVFFLKSANISEKRTKNIE